MSTNISLTPELEKYAKGKVSEGFYSSVSELMREALRLLRRQDIEYIAEIHKELNKAANEINHGKVTALSMQDIMSEVDSELAGQ